MKIKVFLVAGARPNFMKIAPIYEEMKKHPQRFEPLIVHTGQHYDENMSKVFFDDLKLPRPQIYLEAGSGSHAEQTAEIMKHFELQLLEHRPQMVMVVGDVNSTIACALCATKVQIPSENLLRLRQNFEDYLMKRAVAAESPAPDRWQKRSETAPLIVHIEAGERSFDFNMPEEVNRVTTDVLSDMLFTTCRDADEHLLAEGVDARRIFRVGNIMIDSLKKCLKKAEKSQIIHKLNEKYRPAHVQPIRDGEFALATLHRPGNVDEAATLATILSALMRVSVDLPIIIPLHPRTHKLLQKLPQSLIQKLAVSQLLVTEPVGYLDFLHLQTKARLVLTDSGGVQVETSYLGIPCLTLRPTTEWQITLHEGSNTLVPVQEQAIAEAAKKALQRHTGRASSIALWDGQTAVRIVDYLKQFLM